MPKKLTLQDAQMAASSLGGVCLSETYEGTDKKLLWRCSLGHEWWAILQHIRHKGTWCPHCRHRVPPTIDQAREAAKLMGGECLSTSVTKVADILQWQCSSSHQWGASLDSVKGGTWCPHCAGKRRTIEEMRILAEARGGRCLSTSYAPQTKLDWQCSKGHIFKKLPALVIHSGSWCPYCVGMGKTIEDMQRLAESKGGTCLSTIYQSVMLKLTWRCAKGHVWDATPLNVRRTSWCPLCKYNKRENQCRKVFEASLGVPFPKARPTWLRNSKGRQMELDGYSEKLGIAFEYQGFQHYQPGFYQNDEQFAWQQQRDKEKRALCAAQGVWLIEVPWVTKDLEEFVRSHIREHKTGSVRSHRI